MTWLDRIARRAAPQSAARREKALKAFTMPPFWSDGARVSLAAASLSHTSEGIGDGFESYMQSMYKANGPVFSCIVARARVFNQARFLFQRMQGGRPTDLFWENGLTLLERPWQRGTSGSHLTHMEVDASVAGNHYSTVVDADGNIGRAANRANGAYIVRMRPDWCKLIVGSPSGQPYNVDARVVALEFSPPGMRNDPLILLPSEFCHYAPLPDPAARFRGMSWLTPIVREAQADGAYTEHKLAFLKNGATPNLVVNLGDDVEDEDFQAFVAKFKQDYEGAANAYKTLFIAGGADVTPLSVDFKQLDLKATQGGVETRICAAAGVHPVIAGSSEGLQGSSLNAGNFHAARRLFVDSTIRDLWGQACPSLEVFAAPPARTRLWYDARDIPFLRDDAKDEAETFQTNAVAIRQLIEAGFEPDAAVAAAKASDVAALVGKHTGMVSVQLQTPGAPTPAPAGGEPVIDMPALDTRANGRQPANG